LVAEGENWGPSKKKGEISTKREHLEKKASASCLARRILAQEALKIRNRKSRTPFTQGGKSGTLSGGPGRGQGGSLFSVRRG